MSHEYPLNVPAPHHFTFAVRDIPDVTVEQRERVLKATHYNEFAFPAGMLTVDMLSDSGTTAMTNQQWAALFLGGLTPSLGALELAVLTTEPGEDGVIHITMEVAEESIQKPVIRCDESLYYDMLSAFCKSLRGSDADAAMAWFARLLYAGVDPRLIARRIIAHASEDVGLANPTAMLQAVAASQALEAVGLPEARLSMAQAIIAFLPMVANLSFILLNSSLVLNSTCGAPCREPPPEKPPPTPNGSSPKIAANGFWLPAMKCLSRRIRAFPFFARKINTRLCMQKAAAPKPAQPPECSLAWTNQARSPTSSSTQAGEARIAEFRHEPCMRLR